MFQMVSSYFGECGSFFSVNKSVVHTVHHTISKGPQIGALKIQVNYEEDLLRKRAHGKGLVQRRVAVQENV